MTVQTAIALPNPAFGQEPIKAEGIGFFGLFRGARRDPLHFFLRAVEGKDIVEFPNPLGRFFLVNNPQYIGRILQHNYKNYPKSPYYDRVRPIFGDGLFELEGAAWRRKRQTVQPAFHKERVEALASMMIEETERLLDGWEAHAEASTSLDIVPPLMQMTFRVITRALCGADIPGDTDTLTKSLTVIMRAGERVLWSPLPFLYRLPSAHKTRLKRALNTFDTMIYALIKKRQESDEWHDDLLDMLLAVRDSEMGQPLSYRELRDDLMTLLIAGHETTGQAIAWACYLLSKDPHILRKLREENREILGDRRPGLSDLDAMPYNLMVVQETLRLFPTFWTLSRRAENDDTLGPYHIPAGSTLMVSPYVSHRNPSIWHNPEGFDPERFGSEDTRSQFAYIPFGGGPRVCIGKNFALMEAQLCLAMLVQRFRLELVPGYRTEPLPMISLRSSHGIRMAIKPSDLH